MAYATLYDTTSTSTNGAYYWWAADSANVWSTTAVLQFDSYLARDRFNLARARVPTLTAAAVMTHRTARIVPASRKLSHARTTRRRFRDYRRPQ